MNVAILLAYITYSFVDHVYNNESCSHLSKENFHQDDLSLILKQKLFSKSLRNINVLRAKKYIPFYQQQT